MIGIKKIKNDFLNKIFDSFLGTISYNLLFLLFSWISTKLYGAQIFGEFTYVFTVLTLLVFIAKAGLDKGLIYYIPKTGNKYVSTAFFFNVIFSSIVIIITFFTTKNIYLKFSLPMIILLSMEQLFFGIYISEHKIKEYYAVNGFWAMILRIALVIFLYFIMGKRVESILYAIYISLIGSLIFYYVSNKDKFKKLFLDMEFLLYSLPLIIAAVMGIIVEKIDIVMLEDFVSKKDIGIYQVASQIAYITSYVLIIFNTVFASQISKFYHNNEIQQLKHLYSKSTRILGIFSGVVLIIICLLNKQILHLFGKEFISGKWVLIFRGIGQFFNAAVGSVWLMLSMTGKPKLQMFGSIMACVINVVLNYLLIPIYGITGAALASMLAISFINILGYILVKKEFSIKPYKVF